MKEPVAGFVLRDKRSWEFLDIFVFEGLDWLDRVLFVDVVILLAKDIPCRLMTLGYGLRKLVARSPVSLCLAIVGLGLYGV